MKSSVESGSERRGGHRDRRSLGAGAGSAPRADGRKASATRLAVRDLQRRVRVDRRALRAFLRRVVDEVAPPGASTTVVLVGDERMRTLNRVFLGCDSPTDVLSFRAGEPVPPEDGRYLGDIVISADTARRQALRGGWSLPRELRMLTLHGVLHLLGYDHASDQGEMRRIEYRLRRKLGITRTRKRGP